MKRVMGIAAIATAFLSVFGCATRPSTSSAYPVVVRIVEEPPAQAIGSAPASQTPAYSTSREGAQPETNSLAQEHTQTPSGKDTTPQSPVTVTPPAELPSPKSVGDIHAGRADYGLHLNQRTMSNAVDSRGASSTMEIVQLNDLPIDDGSAPAGTTDIVDGGEIEAPEEYIEEQTVRFVSPDTPGDNPAVIGSMWRKYKAFQYKEISETAVTAVQAGSMSRSDQAIVLVIAAASAYAVGNLSLAHAYLQAAVLADHLVLPDPRCFTGVFCEMHAEVVRRLYTSKSK